MLRPRILDGLVHCKDLFRCVLNDPNCTALSNFSCPHTAKEMEEQSY